MTIVQDLSFNASVEKVYSALTSAAEFGDVTGAPADISTDEGGAFTCFGGQIAGRHIELIPNERIVQAWRATSMWDEGVYSIVRFDLQQDGDVCKLRLTHTGYPEDAAGHLKGGWHKMYWYPLAKHLLP